MDLSIIIVSWNVKEKLQANLQALVKSEGGLKLEIFVVDNFSSDGSLEMLNKNFPQVKIIANQNNLGFSRANNQAIKLSTGRYILLLNPDMQVKPDTLKNMLFWADTNPNATVMGCHLVNEKGQTVQQVRKFPQLFDQLCIVFKLPHFIPSILKNYLLPSFNYTEAQAVDSIRGSFFLINVGSFKKISQQAKPLLDEDYFIWFEEVDFCYQVKKMGGEVWYTPNASCIDYVGQSFKQVEFIKTQKYFRDSMLKYFKKWKKPYEYRILFFSWKIIGLFLGRR